MKPALLVIDVQKQFFKFGPTTAQSLDDAIEYINAAIELFREKDLPIICIQHVNKENGLVPGKEGFELPESLSILPSDLHIHKTYGNSFNKTSLAENYKNWMRIPSFLLVFAQSIVCYLRIEVRKILI